MKTSTVEVLAVSPVELDITRLRRLFSHTAWNLNSATNIKQAVEAIQKNRIPVVVTSERLPDGTWSDLLSRLARIPNPPEVILMTDDPDERLWMDVLNRGAYDVLAKPLASSEVFRIISLAWRRWRDRRQRQSAACAAMS
jgi:DNA-binding NtrC family response regulator